MRQKRKIKDSCFAECSFAVIANLRVTQSLRYFQCTVSIAKAMPWPPPMHSVTMPRLRPSRRIE